MCQPAITDCAIKANLTGCSQCKGQGTLVPTSPDSCTPPVCTPTQTLGNDWICRDPVVVSNDPLTYAVSQSFSPEFLQLTDVAIVVELRHRDGSQLDQNHIQQKISDLKVLTITPAQIFSKIDFSQASSSRLVINLEFAQEPDQSSISLTFNPNTLAATQDFSLVDSEQALTIQVTKKVDADQLESDK